jgi:hypothetical protein
MSVSKPIRVAIVPVVLLCALVNQPLRAGRQEAAGRWQLTIHDS